MGIRSSSSSRHSASLRVANVSGSASSAAGFNDADPRGPWRRRHLPEGKSGASKQGAEFRGRAFLAETEHQHVQVHQYRARLIEGLVGNDGFDQHEAGVVIHSAPA